MNICRVAVGKIGFLTAIGLLSAQPAYAAKVPVFFSWGGEHIAKVADFPDTPQFQTKDGQYVDPGYRYKQFKLFFVPVWNYGGKWCGYVGNSERYLDLHKQQLDELAAAVGMTLPESPALPFWDSYGGKLVLLSVVMLVFLYGRYARDSDAPQTAAPIEPK